MEVLVIILGIIIVIALFAGGGLFGWLIKGVETVFSFLMAGWRHTFGCLFWIFAILYLLFFAFG